MKLFKWLFLGFDMLWLAGLMGMMAVRAVTFFETESRDDAAGMSPETVGTPQDDILSGTNGNDNLLGGQGDDQIGGYDGEDDLHGAGGNDQLLGADGSDTLHGEAGNDALYGGDDDDTLYGNNFNDTMHGGAGNDALQGSAGNDNLSGDIGSDDLQGGLDDDTLSGGLGNDSLFGGWGKDLLNGVEDNTATAGIQDIDQADFLNGGGGDDTILAGQDDIITAGAGDDTIVLGDWITEGAAQLIDFNANEDSIILVWDDAAGDEPTIDLAPHPTDPDLTQIIMNGEAVADVDADSDIALTDIALIAQSLAKTGVIVNV
jgi:Ca2+-binding RTX toxin-like protein